MPPNRTAPGRFMRRDSAALVAAEPDGRGPAKPYPRQFRMAAEIRTSDAAHLKEPASDARVAPMIFLHERY